MQLQLTLTQVVIAAVVHGAIVFFTVRNVSEEEPPQPWQIWAISIFVLQLRLLPYAQLLWIAGIVAAWLALRFWLRIEPLVALLAVWLAEMGTAFIVKAMQQGFGPR